MRSRGDATLDLEEGGGFDLEKLDEDTRLLRRELGEPVLQREELIDRQLEQLDQEVEDLPGQARLQLKKLLALEVKGRLRQDRVIALHGVEGPRLEHLLHLLQERLLALLRSRGDCVVGEVKQLEDGDLLQELLNAEKIDKDAQRHGVSGRVLDELLQLRGFDLGEEGGQLLEHLTEEGDDEVLRQLGLSDLRQVDQDLRVVLTQLVQLHQQPVKLLIDRLMIHCVEGAGVES